MRKPSLLLILNKWTFLLFGNPNIAFGKDEPDSDSREVSGTSSTYQVDLSVCDDDNVIPVRNDLGTKNCDNYLQNFLRQFLYK